MKQDNQNYEDKYKEVENDIFCNISKDEPYLNIDYGELNIIGMVQSVDNDEYNKLNLGSNSSNSYFAAPSIDDLLPNEQYHKLCSQLKVSFITKC